MLDTPEIQTDNSRPAGFFRAKRREFPESKTGADRGLFARAVGTVKGKIHNALGKLSGMVRVHIPFASVARGDHGGIDGGIGSDLRRVLPGATTKHEEQEEYKRVFHPVASMFDIEISK